MLNKNEIWNKFAGKKILMIRNDGTCETNVVVGCDPDIGICFAKIGQEHHPWWVEDGALSPRVLDGSLSRPKNADQLQEFIFNQLRSGYVSESAVDSFADELGITWSLFFHECPYSA